MVTALWLARPSSVLLLAPGDHPAIPFVRRVSRAEYFKAVGRHRGYNRAMRAGRVLPVDHLRLDPRCPRAIDIAHDWRGARYAVASPLVAIGMLLTQGGSDWVERDMRRLFADRADADEAAAIAIRSLERLGRSRGH